MNRRARDGNCRGIAADDRRIHPSHCFALLEVLCVYLTPDTGFKAIVTDIANDEEMVPRLLGFKAFADKLVATCFVDVVSPPLGAAAPQPHASSSTAPAAPAPPPTVQPNREFSYGLIDY